MPDIETDTAILPAFLASALINGDTSSFDDNADDMATLQRAHEYLEGFTVVGCSDEAWFAHRCDIDVIQNGRNVACDVLEYQLIKRG